MNVLCGNGKQCARRFVNKYCLDLISLLRDNFCLEHVSKVSLRTCKSVEPSDMNQVVLLVLYL